MKNTISKLLPKKTLILLALFIFAIGTTTSTFAMSKSEGTWISKQYTIEGAWEIHTTEGQTIIKIKDNFKTKGGPDLKVFLSKKDIGSVTGKTATQEAIFISKLQSNKGYQEYILPKGVDIHDYTSLLILCESFNVLWGGSNI